MKVHDRTFASRDLYKTWLKTKDGLTFTGNPSNNYGATHTSSPFTWINESTFVGGCDDTLALLDGLEREKAAAPITHPLNIGVLGTANIARKNIAAIASTQHVHTLVVGSRNTERAALYAAENNVPHSCGSYAEVLNNTQVDAVYLPLPTTTHLEWVAKAAASGKHILCEKPVAVSTSELLQMLRLCKQASVFLMDGVMFMHHRRLPLLHEALHGHTSVLGSQGPLLINSHFSFKGDADFFQNNIRVQTQGDPLGCIGDLGWYNVRFSLFVFDYEMPTSVRCVVHRASAEGVPFHASGTLVWSRNGARSSGGSGGSGGSGSGVPVADRCSNFVCSFLHTECQNATVVGEEGFIELNDFVIPTKAAKTSFRQVKHVWGAKAENIDVQTTDVECVGDQSKQMWETFQQLLAVDEGKSVGTTGSSGRGQQFYMDVVLKTQMIIDALMASSKQGGVEIVLGPVPEY